MNVRAMPNGRQAPRLTSLAPASYIDSAPRVYTAERHARFVSDWVRDTFGGLVQVRGVRYPEELAGLEDATFIIVHDVDLPSDRLSDALGDIASRRGFTLVTIDDSPKRRRHAERFR